MLPTAVRRVLVDYDVTFAVIVTTALSFAWQAAASLVERIELPATLSPTCHYGAAALGEGGHFRAECVGTSQAAAGEHRSWLISFEGAGLTLWLAAFASAVPITFFFYMDQNISSLLCQLPEYNLQHGHYYHSSFLWMGLFNAVGPLFGLPFVTGSLPHSPQFVRALSLEGAPPVVAENRVAPLLMYAMLGLPLLAPGVLGLIPRAAINGVLIYVGMEVSK